MVNTNNFWKGKRVFVTGHTGFKGGWLSVCLDQLGAKIYGYSLPPPTSPNFYEETGIKKIFSNEDIADIRDAERLRQALKKAQPEIIFHLAAQPLVKYSYDNPIETLEVNIIGTANLLNEARAIKSVKTIVNITTDKCYKNEEWSWPYRETDTLGGGDPYSCSKACAELVTDSFRDSFCSKNGIALSTVRAGNVIGGGDWAKDRLIPDIIKAFHDNTNITIRSPNAIRPWQHVLEPLFGYILLAEKQSEENDDFNCAWNFGPDDDGKKNVKWILDYIRSKHNITNWRVEENTNKQEAKNLRIDSSKAKCELNWRNKWTLENSLDKTIEWYRSWQQEDNMLRYTRRQIDQYQNS